MSWFLTVYFKARHLSILNLVGDGLTNKEIGLKLSISKQTVETIRTELITRTNSKNTAQLIAFAFRNGLLILLFCCRNKLTANQSNWK
ncbi:response regulator transcription factor [Pedobacter fastidiosus]|uniref:Response regulator transcription factor n=1 Tax=Pedobacter fastidiosus TaxID=2765361 RepID=A0ABR7KXE0_9SPHI|nr:LuxR C-terminal-related transcriptional regulator [Pedobacter fastidiosus]MBC6112784.1 response regulator transcription factor [Pedobacter fastidiosus]